MNFGFNFLYKSISNTLQTFGSITNNNLLCNSSSSFLPLKTINRFYERRRFIRRYGYRPHYHKKGLLPRLKDEPFPMRLLPHETKPDPWRKQAALFGQNDYIDILSGDRVHPTDTMQSIPSWLRKFHGNEMQMLIRRRKAKAHWQWFRPQKWNDLNKRIDFLYKRLNYKQPPRPPEYPSNY